jgi:predicted deacylase
MTHCLTHKDSPCFQVSHLGSSSLGLPIECYHLNPKGTCSVLILGGVHGDEVEGVTVALGLLKALSTESFLTHFPGLIPMECYLKLVVTIKEWI